MKELFEQYERNMLEQIDRFTLTIKETEKLNSMVKECRINLDWYYKFAYNINNQGWISKKQRKLLDRFDYEHEINKTYAPGAHCSDRYDQFLGDEYGQDQEF